MRYQIILFTEGLKSFFW